MDSIKEGFMKNVLTCPCAYGYKFKVSTMFLCVTFLLLFFNSPSFTQTSDSVNFDTPIPEIVFTELTVFNKPVKVGQNEPLQKPISEADKILLSYDQTVFSISFRAINSPYFEKTEFFYYLIGFDKGWQKAGNNKTIRYTNIEPGRYIFKVRARDNEGYWNEDGKSLGIIITPPIWATLPFRLIASFAIFFIIYGLYKLRTNSITERNKELAAMNRELNDQIYQRIKLQEQLDQTQKLDSIGTLAGGIAHDFNNLLTVIKGYSDIALVKIKDKEDPVYKNISQVLIATERAENLTNQILTFSRKQIYNPKILEINKVIMDSHKMLHRLIGEDIHIEMKLLPEIPTIKADPVQIEQILINLIVNARDAINQKTDKASEKKITIETNQQILDNDFAKTHVTSQIGLHVVITISDNGIGMNKDVVEKIFEPFYTTKDKGKGTGLGLATVYGIIKQNRSNIFVYSEPGKGTTFKVYWQASQETATISGKRDSESLNLSGKESLLIVEDDDDVRKLASSALSEFGYEVSSAEDGNKALEFVNENNQQIDLLITDLIMPGMNGKELSEKIKSLKPDIKILFVSGYTEEHIAQSGKLDKNINFLSKPYTMVSLAQKVREVLDAG